MAVCSTVVVHKKGGEVGLPPSACCKVLGTISHPFEAASANETILSRMAGLEKFIDSQGAFNPLMLLLSDSLIGGVRLSFGSNRQFYLERPE